MGPYRIRPLERGEGPALLAAFHAAFPAARARTLEEWRWAFEHNPAGTRVFVAEHEGEIVAQYAALPAGVWIDGRARTFGQVVDSFVAPAHRAGLKRPGLFVRTAQAFFEAFGGREDDLVFYGLPVPAALRVGERFLGYSTVRTQNVLVRDVSVTAPPADAEAEVEVLESFDHQARWLWERCACGFGASTVRDARWLTWRYLEHPRERYVPLAVRDAAGVLRGLAVYKHGTLVLERQGILVDWLVPPEEPEVGERLLRALAARAQADGAAVLLALLPEWSPWCEAFQERGWRVHPSDHRMVARSFHRPLDVHWLRRHWWYQPGDTDLV